MQAEFWHERWKLDEIGFHQAQIHPWLIEYWSRLGVADGQVFVPLCGKTLDIAWLRSRGHPLLGVELSAKAIREFFSEQALAFTVGQDGAFEVYQSAGLELLCGDFFQLQTVQLAQVKAVYDRAALVALPKDLQARYALHLLAILPRHTPILLVTFEYQPAEMQGPPFSTPRQAVEDLFGHAYRIEWLSTKDALDENPGLKSRGLSRLTETAYWLTA